MVAHNLTIKHTENSSSMRTASLASRVCGGLHRRKVQKRLAAAGMPGFSHIGKPQLEPHPVGRTAPFASRDEQQNTGNLMASRRRSTSSGKPTALLVELRRCATVGMLSDHSTEQQRHETGAMKPKHKGTCCERHVPQAGTEVRLFQA